MIKGFIKTKNIENKNNIYIYIRKEDRSHSEDGKEKKKY